MKKAVLFDWGNTLMKDFPYETGKMKSWQQVEAMPNAEFLLKELSKKRNCYIATNAIDSEKEDIIEALKRVGLNSYLKDIFCYKEIGYLKPSKAFFDIIISKLNIQKEEALMIGDDLEKDAKGAQDCGIESILYDFKNEYQEYQGKRIVDLCEVLKWIK